MAAVSWGFLKSCEIERAGEDPSGILLKMLATVNRFVL